MPTPSQISKGKTDDVNEDVLDGNTQDNKTEEVANDGGHAEDVSEVVLDGNTRDAEDAQQGECIKLFIYVYKKLYKLNLLTNIHPRPNNADIAKKGENSTLREECNMGKKSDNDSAHHSGECQNSKPYRLIKILVI